VWSLSVIAALVCAVAGLIAGRPDTVALATPFALLALSRPASGRGDPAARSRFTVDRRPRAGSRVRLVLAPAPAPAPAPDNAGPSARRLVATTMSAPGRFPEAVVLRDDEECPVLVDAPLSGELEVLSYGSMSIGPDLSHPRPFDAAPPVRVSILPSVGAEQGRPVSRRLVGLTGTHRSGRPGEGGEMRSIAPLQPGDQLRRIDWRATARRSADQDRIMVRRTFADAEASVILVIDTGHDLPASTADWFATGPQRLLPGSLHLARMAATAVAASYLAVGDRVGLDDLSGARRPLRSAAGVRHLEQIRTRLAGTGVVPRRRRLRDPVPPSGAVVLVFSAFLDAEPARLLRLWHAQGHVVVGVDCVPVLERTEATTAQALAVRLTLLRRRLVLDGLRSDGLPVLRAQGDPDGPSRGEAGRSGGSPDTGGDTLAAGLRVLARQAVRRPGRASGPLPVRRTP
jgi:uncharacterized protein (DUF58 family)